MEGGDSSSDEDIGGIYEVNDFQNSVEIDEIARFAVDEHNKKQNKVIEFDKVVNLKQQVVAGIIYHLTLEVVEDGKKNMYEAQIWVKSWINFKELLDFRPLPDSASLTTSSDLVAD